jgi:hypothetical protein
MLGRIGFWYVAAIVATVVMAGIGAASTLNNTLVGTGGNVIGVVVGGAPHFFGAFQDGLAGGSGNTSTFSFTRTGEPASATAPGEATAPRRPGCEDSAVNDARPTFDELMAQADAGWENDCRRPLLPPPPPVSASPAS